jgi:hypothetical protein
MISTEKEIFSVEGTVMNIFFWFLILAVITLMINGAMIYSMHRQGRYRYLSIVLVLVTGYLLAALLYLLTWTSGTYILSKTLACTMPIETESYRSAEANGITSYAFCSEEGITFRFDETELLETEVPPAPSTLEVYFCRTRTGLSWCYLSEGTTVKYLLK